MDKNLHLPVKNYYKEGSSVTIDSNVSYVDRGVDPKPLILEFCKPHCVYWKEKLERCESKLATIIKVIILTSSINQLLTLSKSIQLRLE